MRVLGGIRTPNIQPLKLASLPRWSTSTWSPCPEPNGDLTLTKRRLYH